MEIVVVSRRDNPLLRRTEVRFRVRHPKESTPAREELRQALAQELEATKDIVIVDHARSVFGRSESEGFAKVYKTKEDALRTERTFILVRNRLKEATVKAKKERKQAPPKPAPARPVAPAAKEEAKPSSKPAEKPAPVPPKKEGGKPEAPAKKEPPKKDEKPAEKKPAKGA